MKKADTVLREYASRISDEDLRYLYSLLSQKLFGDTSEALNMLSRANDMDRLLRDQKGSIEVFDILDKLQTQVEREYRKRNGDKDKHKKR